MSRSFADLGVPVPLVDVLTGLSIVTPTPIQEATLPDALSGRDVLGRGRTGSGKTYAFCLPLVTRLAASGGRRKRNSPRGLILAPTRELARQIEETLAPLAKAMGLRTTVIFGGVTQGRQVSALEQGVDIVVACPGRLEDLMKQKHCRMDQIEVSVLDEADHMADLGFLPGVTRILAATPKGAQRLLFSATLDQGVDTLVKKFLDNPVVHEVDDGSANPNLTAHHVIHVDPDDRVRALADLAVATPRTVMFTRTKHGAKRLAKQLAGRGVSSVDLHGNLSQNARVRNLEAFSSGQAKVLVATDIAARGIHVDDVGLVVHADPPAEHKAYVHRSGRTARAGAIGTVVTVATSDQVREVRSLLRAAGVTAGEIVLPVGADAGAALADAPAPPPHVPGNHANEPSQGQSRQSQNRQRQGRSQGGQGSGGQGSGRQGQGRDGGERVSRDQDSAGSGGARRRPRGPQSAGTQGAARQGSGHGSTRQGSTGQGAGAQRAAAPRSGASHSIAESAGQSRGGQRRKASRAAG
ncbi:DEAD/DEAH box helicase [Rhodococcus sp. IEGM 1408]|uniref:DEAD/DEAH box helicase n=1 Tax=Rhodococcus sp. IEGM 1408 TaxID=3082220 RepID=UPI00295493BB|nr:DEAD/DEAH box helicase [Rhodococcus sp. IEGM 1408]MDV7999844.1 DEAD/DEAH box helicase [Rhodococcus sp. IEGM 1408]